MRQSIFADRHPSAFNKASFNEFCELIAESNGNTESVKVREIDDGEFKYEIASGHRRHQAAIRTGTLLKIEVIDAPNGTDLVKQMYRENSGRSALSKFEQGLSWSKWVREGLFKSGRQLAAELNLSHTIVQKLMKFSHLPEYVINAFEDPTLIRLEWVPSILEAINENAEEVRKRCAAHGIDAASPMKIYKHIIGHEDHKQIVTDENGHAIRIRQANGSFVLVLPKETGKDEALSLSMILLKHIKSRSNQ